MGLGSTWPGPPPRQRGMGRHPTSSTASAERVTKWYGVARRPDLLLDDDNGSRINRIGRLNRGAAPEIDLSPGVRDAEAAAAKVRI